MRMHKVEKLSFLPSYVTAFAVLVYRLAYNGDIAAGQLAVFQGASDEHI